jgi:hypothetical protein
VTGDDGSTAVVTFTATATTVANVAAGLVAAWNLSTHRLCTPITASGSTTNVILTADTAGVPFSVAGTTTDGGGANTQTLTRTATTANVGGSDAGLAGNYYANALPSNSGDNLTIDGRNLAAVAYGKNLSAKTITLMRVLKSNAYNVGLAPSSTNPTAEYLPRLGDDVEVRRGGGRRVQRQRPAVRRAGLRHESSARVRLRLSQHRRQRAAGGEPQRGRTPATS